MTLTPIASKKAGGPSPYLALVLCAGLVVGMAMGARHVQGLFMLPLLAEKGWGRESFSFALGLQVLVWGLLQPVTGLLADRFGTGRVIAAGCLLYAVGLVVEAVAGSTGVLVAGTGLVVGVALTATTFAVVYGGLSRLVPPERRGTAQGVAGGIGGFIQFLLVPAAQIGIGSIGWSATLQVLAVLTMLCGGAAWVLSDRRAPAADAAGRAAPPVGPVVRAAMRHSGFWLLNLGFVSCGFQLAFLGAHLPAYLKDAGLDTSAGVNAIAIIALANAIGTYVCGRLGDFYRKKYLLSLVYTLRTAAMVAFVALPLSTTSLYLFALVMGATWLGTVPLTNGVIAQIFGVRYIGTLFGLVFLGHQLGGFFGAWLGGLVYDATQSYGLMWGIAIALGLASIVLNLPIRDRSIEHRFEAVPA
ncbi:MAG: MFS transporter [Piscinibacter sp.]|nr:MFS transporter [Piscinibacter sp.]